MELKSAIEIAEIAYNKNLKEYEQVFSIGGEGEAQMERVVNIHTINYDLGENWNKTQSFDWSFSYDVSDNGEFNSQTTEKDREADSLAQDLKVNNWVQIFCS